MDGDELVGAIGKANLPQEEKAGMVSDILAYGNLTLGAMEQSVKFSAFADRTVITNEFVAWNEMNDTVIYLYMPECLSRAMNRTEFMNNDYIIVQNDSIFAWKFNKITDKAVLEYVVHGSIGEDCISSIKAQPVAKSIGQKTKSPADMLVLLLIIPLVFFIATYFHKFVPRNLDEEQQRERALQKYIEKTAARVRVNYRGWTREQIANRLRLEGMSDRVIREVIRRL